MYNSEEARYAAIKTNDQILVAWNNRALFLTYAIYPTCTYCELTVSDGWKVHFVCSHDHRGIGTTKL